MKPCTSSFTGLPETLTALPARQIQLRLNSYEALVLQVMTLRRRCASAFGTLKIATVIDSYGFGLTRPFIPRL
jgi:hypothetical protein